MESRHLRHPKIYARALAVGIILAVFLYIVLLLLLPFVIGAWAFLAAIVIAIPFLGHLLRVRRSPKRRPLYRPLPQRMPFGPRRIDSLERLVAGTFVVTVGVIGLMALGEFLYAAGPFDSTGVVLGFIGYAFIQVGIYALIGLHDAARWPMGGEYFSNLDTTDDH